MSRRCPRWAAALGLTLYCLFPMALRAQGATDVAGTWLARNVRSASGQPITVALELSQTADSVVGQLQTELPSGSRGAPVAVRGVVRADSLLLSNVQGNPVLAVQVRDRRLVGRMAGSPGRLNRPVPNLTSLEDARAVRFERP